MPLDIRKATGSRQQLRVVNVEDFDGGLNLQADPLALADNECPELLNVDIDRRGGFQMRKGVQLLTTTPFNENVVAMTTYTTAAGAEQLIVDAEGASRYSTNGGVSFTDIVGDETDFDHPDRYAVFDNTLYIARGNKGEPCTSWDGTTADDMTESGAGNWQDDVFAPVGGFMPQAKVIAAHQAYLWVANTTEDATQHGSRLRWSQPGRPEDWREADFIDVEVGKDSDEITALVPYEDKLLVFKRHSVHLVRGYDPFTFSVEPISQTVGAASAEAVVATPFGVFCFHDRDGVWMFDGKKMSWLFERLDETLKDGTIPHAYHDEVALGWLQGRLWVGVPWLASVGVSHTLVFDPTVGKHGAWTLHDVPSTAFATLADGTPLAGLAGLGGVAEVELGNPYDLLGDGEVHIDSYLRTPWYDDGQIAVAKRWRRPDLLAKGGATQSLTVEVYRDWDARSAAKSFNVTMSEDEASAVWDVAEWDEAAWASGDADYNRLERGSSLGNARAVSLKFRGPQQSNTPWGIDAVALKYKPKRVRG